MAQVGNWTERFGISKADFDQLKRSAEANNAGDDVLRWCLMNGRISENEYIDWAMKQFEMPSVSGDYFTVPADHSAWDRFKGLHSWSPSFFPLTEWDGILLIACLEPPKEFRLKQPHRFVLASARHLFFMWQTLNPVEDHSDLATSVVPTSSIEIKSATNEMPDGFVSDTSTGVSFNLAPDETPDGLSGVDLSKVTDEPSFETEHVEEPQAEMPDGISAVSADALSGLNFGNMFGDAASEKPKKEEPKHDSVSFHDEVTHVGDEPKAEEPVVTKAVAPEKPAAPKKEEPKQPARPSVLKPKSTPEVKAEAKPVAKQEAKTPPPPPAPVQEEAPALPEKPAPSQDEEEDRPRFGLSMVELRPVELAHSIDDLAALSIAHTLKFQAGALVLFFDGNQLKPWRWSDLMTTPKNKSVPTVDLTQPSIFSIVNNTKLPYHGQVATSAVNDAFFSAYYLPGGLPKLVTMVPIEFEGRLFGMLLGIPKTEIAYKQALPPMEKLANSIASRFAEIKAAKAA